MSSVDKAAKLLQALSREPYEFRVTDLAREIDCGASGTYKLLTSLCENNLVEQNDNKLYRLGIGIYFLGHAYEDSQRNWTFCRKYLERVRDYTNENVVFGAYRGGHPVMVDRVEGREVIQVLGLVGSKRPFNASSIGKTLGAYSDPQRVLEHIRKHPLERFTANTIVDIDELFLEYARIREQGHAISREESVEGVVGIGVPVHTAGGLLGVISVSVPTSRMTDERQKRLVELIKKVAKEASEDLWKERG